MIDSLALQAGAQAPLPEGFLLGHAQNADAGTGCTVVLCEQGAVAGVAVRGAAPATRETDLLNPCNTVEKIHATILSGGSAFGLDAAGGVMRWLAERGIGLNVGAAVVPIVCGACIFDLGVGDGSVRPDAALGYAACEAAATNAPTPRSGNVGVGTGASVGKLLGEASAMKCGFGIAGIRLGELIVTALVAVNALGNVFDRTSGQTLAGARDPRTKSTILNPYEALSLMSAMAGAAEGGMAGAGGSGNGAAGEPSSAASASPLNTPTANTGASTAPTAGANTTIGCILTNGMLTKAQATRVADMAHDGFARAIEPVHTGFDGDTIFALSTAVLPTSPDLLGALAAFVMEAAIHDAARSATSAFGLPSARDLH
ncbi:MAG: P1 family peptidase [Coriobacteriales bacterium]|jgi:L-aminopeptidase/D-esterase-like protein|nr:P1 family peptidase [Coriobacteriales bacterium]